jgi:hypothetical protein
MTGNGITRDASCYLIFQDALPDPWPTKSTASALIGFERISYNVHPQRDVRSIMENLGIPLINIPRATPLNKITPDYIKNAARDMHSRIVKSIILFEKKLDQTQEIGAKMTSFGLSEIIHIDSVGWFGADMIIFAGRNLDDQPVQLLQHVSQLSVLLIALPIQKGEPKRIGFALQEAVKHSAQPE